MRRSIHTLNLAACATLLLVIFQACYDNGNRLILFLEEGKIRDAARTYLDAEKRGDLKTVYSCLAPSSHYVAAHPRYEDYLAEMQKIPIRIIDYKILEISRLRDNHDRGKYPRIEKFVQVEVDVTFSHMDNKATVPVNYCFTFVKEGGKWYKG